MKRLYATLLLCLCSCDSSPRRLGYPIPNVHKSSIIDLYSKANHLPSILVKAVIQHESRGLITAQRFEPHHLWTTCKGRKDCATSWGLGQVMGFHAKALNLTSERELLNPEVNVWATTKILGSCYKKHSGDTRRTLACYNGDKTGRYAKKVTKTMLEILEKHHVKN